jgi:ABC-type Co2+ transport system permease subunit
MRLSTLLAIHAGLFLAIFFCLGFSALALGDEGFLVIGLHGLRHSFAIWLPVFYH